jgi:hypothetical protein
VPAVGVDQADRHPEAGRLAGAVGPEQADDLPPVDLELDPVDDLAAAVPFLQAADFQQGHGSLLLDRPDRSSGLSIASPAAGVRLARSSGRHRRPLAA